jgi:hypothetical protein
MRLTAAALVVTLWATACAAPMKQTAEMQGGAFVASLAASEPASEPSSAPVADPDDVVVELPPGKCFMDWECWKTRATMLNRGYTARGGLIGVFREKLQLKMSENIAGKALIETLETKLDEANLVIAENQALLAAAPSAVRYLIYGVLIGAAAATAVLGGLAIYFGVRAR